MGIRSCWVNGFLPASKMVQASGRLQVQRSSSKSLLPLSARDELVGSALFDSKHYECHQYGVSVFVQLIVTSINGNLASSGRWGY